MNPDREIVVVPSLLPPRLPGGIYALIGMCGAKVQRSVVRICLSRRLFRFLGQQYRDFVLDPEALVTFGAAQLRKVFVKTQSTVADRADHDLY